MYSAANNRLAGRCQNDARGAGFKQRSVANLAVFDKREDAQREGAHAQPPLTMRTPKRRLIAMKFWLLQLSVDFWI